MSTQRDELAREIHSTEQLGCGCCTDYNYTREQDQHADKLDVNTRAVAIGDTLLAAGWTKPRTITAVEELDALGFGAVVHSSGHVVWEKFAGAEKWARSGQDFLGYATAIALPATVLFEPTA